MLSSSLYALMVSGLPVFICGRPGVGKAAVVRLVSLSHPERVLLHLNLKTIDELVGSGQDALSLRSWSQDMGYPFTFETEFLEKRFLISTSVQLSGKHELRGKQYAVIVFLDEVVQVSLGIKHLCRSLLFDNQGLLNQRIGHQPWLVATGTVLRRDEVPNHLEDPLLLHFIKILWDPIGEMTARLTVPKVLETLRRIVRERVGYDPGALAPEVLEVFLDTSAGLSGARLVELEVIRAMQSGDHSRSIFSRMPLLPSAQELLRCREVILTGVMPKVESELSTEIARLKERAELVTANPFPVSEKISQALDAAAVLVALHRSTAHPDIAEAVIGAVGQEVGQPIADCISELQSSIFGSD